MDCLGEPPLGHIEQFKPKEPASVYQGPQTLRSSIWWGTSAKGHADLKQKLTRHSIPTKDLLRGEEELQSSPCRLREPCAGKQEALSQRGRKLGQRLFQPQSSVLNTEGCESSSHSRPHPCLDWGLCHKF